MALNLKTDEQGFLIGEPIEIERALEIWDAIRSDVAAIRNAVMRIGKTAGKEPRTPAVGPVLPTGEDVKKPRAAVPRARGDSPENPVKSERRPATPKARATKENESSLEPRKRQTSVVAEPLGRDVRGRFVKKNTQPGTQSEKGNKKPPRPGEGGNEDGSGDHLDSSALRDMSERIVNAIGGARDGMEEVDPAVKAFNEVAQPMARGFELIRGNKEERRNEGWFRRIFGELRFFRKEETAYSKAAKKSLETIEDKPDAESGGGGLMSGLLGGLISKIPFLGPLLTGGAGMLRGGGKGLLGGLGGLGKGLLRRLPLIGALIGGLGAAFDVFGSETDGTLTRKEKDKRAGKAIGGFAGSVGGMLAGAKLGAMMGAIGGPIGIAIGGVVGGAVGMFFGDQAGQILGDKVGGWINDLRQANIPDKIFAAWDSAVAAVKAGWERVVSGFSSVIEEAAKGWDAAKKRVNATIEGGRLLIEDTTNWAADKASAANTYIKEKTGVDVKAGVEKTATAAKQKAVEIGTKAAEGVEKGVDWAAENTTVGKGIKAAGSVLESALPKGFRSKALFDGVSGGGALNQYGRYTDAEAERIRSLKESGANTSANLQGGMPKEIRDKIAAQAKLAGLDPVTMLKIAAMESGGNANAISSTGAIGIYQFTGQTASGAGIKNRFDVDQNIEGGMRLTKQNQAALKKMGLPVTAENLYMMHQLGPRAAGEVIRAAAEGKMKEELSPETQKAMNLNYGNNSKTAAEYVAANKAALDRRYATIVGGTKTAVAGVNVPEQNISVPAPQQVQTAYVKTAPVMNLPSPLPIAAAPAIVTPLAGGSDKKTVATSTPVQDVGQDVKDRRIAHIVTGGISGA